MSNRSAEITPSSLDAVEAAVNGHVGSDGQGRGVCPLSGKGPDKFAFSIGDEGLIVLACHCGKCSSRAADNDWSREAAEALAARGVPRRTLKALAHQSQSQTRSSAHAVGPAPDLPSAEALDRAQHRLIGNRRQLDLLKQRVGLSLEQAVNAGLGWDAHEKRMWLPVEDDAGNLLTIIRRDFRPALPTGRVKSAIWKGSKGAFLYAPFGVRSGEPVIVTAGERDCLALCARGLNAVCFTNGEKAVPPPERMTALLDEHLVFAYDNDEGGTHVQKVASAVLPHAASVRIVNWSSEVPEGYDVWDILSDDKLGVDAVEKALVDAGPWSAGEARTASVEAEAERIRLRREAARLVDAEETASRIVVLPRATLRDVMKQERPEQPPLRIARLHRVGHNTTITARYKTGKTTFSANLLRCLVDGEPFLDEFHVLAPDGRVAFLNYELSDWDFVDWLEAIGIRDAKRVAPLNLRGVPFSLALERNQEELVTWAREMDAEVLFLDPHRRSFAGFGSENSNDDVNRYTDVLDVIKAEAGVKDLFLNVHTGRAQGEIGEERSRGATALDDWTDNRLILTLGEDGERYCYAADGRTGEVVPEFRLEYDRNTRRLSAEDGNRRDGAASVLKPQVLNALEAAGSKGALMGELESRIAVKKKGALRQPIAQLVAEGLVVQVAQGSAKRNWLKAFAPTAGEG